MLWIDGFFRFTGVGFLLLLAVLALRDGKSWISKPYLTLSCLTVGALFLGYVPPEIRPPEPIYTVSRFLDVPHLVFVWLFALSLYDTHFRLRWMHVVIGVLYSSPIFVVRLQDFGLVPKLPFWVFVYGSVSSLLLMGHICFVTLKGRADDLLEARRASRVYFISVLIFITVAAAIIDILPREIGGMDRRTLKILSIWPAIVWGTIWLLAFNQRSAHMGAHSGSGRPMEHRDAVLANKLKSLMETDQVFREPGLTIKTLANQLGTNQHKLRALINQDLGYINFSAYINLYRIEAVKRDLANPETSHLPILTLAMDNGFKSLSTFNKAFKALEGVTPTAYRKGFKT